MPKGENEDVGQKILTLFNDTMKVTPPVTPDQIDRVHRVGPSRSDQPPSILVKFSTYRYRNKVFRAKKALKESNQSSDDKVFINEDLTKFRSNLLYLARNMKRDKLIQDCWSWDGTVLVKNKSARIIPIHSAADLERAVG